MAKYALRAGAEIDLLTADELDTKLAKRMGEFATNLRDQEGATVIRTAAPFTLNGSGNTVGSNFPDNCADIYRVPVGYDAFLTRLSVDYEGSSAASTVSCDVRVVADANTPAALRTLYDAIPSVYEASKSHAAVFRGGQRVGVSITGATANLQVYVTVQVLLVKRSALQYDIEAG